MNELHHSVFYCLQDGVLGERKTKETRLKLQVSKSMEALQEKTSFEILIIFFLSSEEMN